MGLRERKKAVTREALSEAALRLALEHGPENVRVDDIAEAAGVSPRTYNNYFPSREAAIVAAIAAERALRVAALLRARPADEPLADSIVEALVDLYSDEPAGDALTLITTSAGLRSEFVDTAVSIEQTLASAIAERVGEGLTPDVLAAAVSAAARIALQHWLRPSDSPLVVVGSTPLADVIRAALNPLLPALRAADTRCAIDES